MTDPSLTLDIWMDVLDLLTEEDLETVASTSEHMKGVVTNYVRHQLKFKVGGLSHTQLELNEKDPSQLTRQEYKFLFQSKRGKKIPSSLPSAIAKLKQIRQIKAMKEKTIYRKFCNNITNMAFNVQPHHVFYGHRSLGKTKFVPRKVLRVDGRFKLTMPMGDIHPGSYKINFIIKASPRSSFVGRQTALVKAEIRDRQRLLIQNTSIDFNIAELKNPGMSEKVTRIEKTWVQLSVPIEIQVEGHLWVTLDCQMTRINRRVICIDSVEVARD